MSRLTGHGMRLTSAGMGLAMLLVACPNVSPVGSSASPIPSGSPSVVVVSSSPSAPAPAPVDVTSLPTGTIGAAPAAVGTTRSEPVIAVGVDGSAVVTWTESRNGEVAATVQGAIAEPGSDVPVRRLAWRPDPAFLQSPGITADPTGSHFIVGWVSDDGGRRRVWTTNVRVADSAASLATPLSDTFGAPGQVRLTCAEAGGACQAVWSDQRNGPNILYGQTLPRGVDDRELFGASTDHTPVTSLIPAGRTGGYTVAWPILGRGAVGLGTVREGTGSDRRELMLSTATATIATPMVATHPKSGRSLVAWIESLGPGPTVRARAVEGPDTAVTTVATAYRTDRLSALLPAAGNDGFIVVWHDRRFQAIPQGAAIVPGDTLAQRLDGIGRPIGGPIVLVTGADVPSLASDASGRHWWLAWRSPQDQSILMRPVTDLLVP
ncbi:MAG: hypothetical protein H7338_15455 [Candidatus Sericytochromatia bacterium]|nr:hypothetical protein [Candidatus Sericytochromatia bacterium]